MIGLNYGRRPIEGRDQIAWQPQSASAMSNSSTFSLVSSNTSDSLYKCLRKIASLLLRQPLALQSSPSPLGSFSYPNLAMLHRSHASFLTLVPKPALRFVAIEVLE